MLALWHAAAQDLPWAAARVHLLDAAERAALAAHAPGHGDRAWFVLSRVLRRVALEAGFGTPAQNWRFATTPSGAPTTTRPYDAFCTGAASDPAASLSHSRGHVVVAAADSAQLGVDVESLGRLEGALSRVARLMARVLTAAEQQQVRALPEPQWPAAVLQRWALKEAVAKAVGQGLRGPWRKIAPELAHAPLAAGEHRRAQTPLLLPDAWRPLARAPIWCGLHRPKAGAPVVIAWATAAERPPAVRVHTP